jgi:chromosome partitioning protein
MQILTIANQKGGVGKSTIAVHLAWHALEARRPVLLIDLDGQANATRTFATRVQAGTLTAARLFTDEPADRLPQLQEADGLTLIGADMEINDVEREPLQAIARPAAWLRALEAAGRLAPDTLAIIDTPPTLGRRLLAALIASTAVVAPIGLNGYSIQGVTDLQKTIQTVRRQFNPTLANLGLLANMVNLRTATHRRLLDELTAALPGKVLPFHIAHRVAIADAIDNRRPAWRATHGASGLAAGREMSAVCARVLGSL